MTATPVIDDPRWIAILQRDPAADGAFVYAVKTTGIFCHPSCASRLPRRENVTFHSTPAAATLAGFRPCKRCQPGGPSTSDETAEKIAQACRLIETQDPAPKLIDLARRIGISPHHFHRLFTKTLGITPKAYATARRAGKIRQILAHSPTITHAIYESGYQSNSRFYSESQTILGMKPQKFRNGAPRETIRYAIGPSALGHILVAASETGICAIFLGDDPGILAETLHARFPKALLAPGGESFQQHIARIIALAGNPTLDHRIPLDIRGTAFQHQVWTALTQIPPGQTANYAEIARNIGRPKSVRAVAGACAANKLAIVIPCHRVIATSGHLTGYRWGLERKKALLDLEKNGSAEFIPPL